MLLKHIVDGLAPYPQLFTTIPFLKIKKFVRFARCLKCEIQITQLGIACPTEAPLQLSLYIHESLWDVLVFRDTETIQCWAALRDVIWDDTLEPEGSAEELAEHEAALFQQCGAKENKREHISM
jgi:hypothetical protein